MFNTDQLTISDYLNKSFPCECGRVHSVPIKHIVIREDALDELPDILANGSFHKPFFLFDLTTYSVAGNRLKEQLEKAGLAFTRYIINEDEPTPDEKTIGELLIHFDPACDIIAAVGSGTLNDLSRFVSYKLNLPYMIIATAPSMDGFASNVAPLIVNHMKTTYEAQVPYAILADIDIIKDAPMKMIAAGIGDILGKYTCLCDWTVAHEINGEYHCAAIEKLVRRSIAGVVANIDGAANRTPAAIRSIMEALVLSGIAMSFSGNSRPASGSEHHLSHYWEMMFLFENKKPILHGTKVGIGTVAIIRAYEILFSGGIDFARAKKTASNYNQKKWEAAMQSAYLDAAPSVIALERQVKKNEPENVLPRIELFRSNWDKLKGIAGRLPSSDSIREMLLSLNAPASPAAVGIDKTTFINSFLAAKELRNRFGLLQILFDLDLAREIAEKVWDYFEKQDEARETFTS